MLCHQSIIQGVIVISMWNVPWLVSRSESMKWYRIACYFHAMLILGYFCDCFSSHEIFHLKKFEIAGKGCLREYTQYVRPSKITCYNNMGIKVYTKRPHNLLYDIVWWERVLLEGDIHCTYETRICPIMYDYQKNLFVELIGKCVCHHCLPSTRWSMKQHHHASTISDSIIQAHLLTALLVSIKVADRVQDKLFLLFAKNHLMNI